MKVRDIIKLIQKDGWFFKRQKGSHMVFIHKIKTGIVVIPNHGMNEDVKKGTESSILKQEGLK